MALLFISSEVLSQNVESGNTLGFDYRTMPSFGNHQWNAMHFRANYIIELGSKTDIALSTMYRSDDFTYFGLSDIDESAFEDLHSVDLQIGWQQKLKKNWTLNVSFMPRAASNFSASMSNEDFFFMYGANLTKQWKGQKGEYSITMGLEQNTLLGKPRLLPTVSMKFDGYDTWGYTIGFPSSSVNARVGERHLFLASAVLEGLYFNNSSEGMPMVYDQVYNSSKLAFTGLDIGLSHKYRLQPNITTHARVGFSLSNTWQLQDGDTNVLYDFNADETIYFTMGLTYNLKLFADE
ncbi:DUF6268 family outer membrane beta-barrel protein [Allomuricauda sp. SCSIO 65647]|uniref:DUF6268 family outer membrane beta-barrel protein n=1 Tax=Allomuricauda sp. SCSIO 65647 TaxID=2908843 RepID=UPI001F4585B0|nr:DUF6268 family outer membrane beta-barrel protein [Muricauda sp. SCSIO 65647]UJH69144.1 DUF6268 family outer membrane beta-barrel protein [Muricauda sp. SCSIO 65647]